MLHILNKNSKENKNSYALLGKKMSQICCYRIRFKIPKENSKNFLMLISEILVPDSLAVGELAEGIKPPKGLESVELLFQERPNEAVLQTLFATDNITPIDYLYDTIMEQDWVAASLRELPAIHAGRFYIHGSHLRPTQNTGKINLEIDAGLAFGTGHHETTEVCLKILSHLSKSFKPKNIADIGTGTGVLAIGAAKIWGGKNIIATDIDKIAVLVTKRNLKINQVRHRVRVGQAAGTVSPFIQKSAPYDLLIANILARPLVAMAGDFEKIVQKNGYILLSGLLWWQRKRVAAAYTAQGLRVVSFTKCGEWCGLLLKKP